MANKKLKCKRCGHSWIYKGKRTFSTCCPNCRTTIMIQCAKIYMETENAKKQKD
ncbi:hypothetical protein ES702_02749 [subsurface metagenome]